MKDFYSDYIKKIERGSVYDMSYSSYVKIVTDLHKGIMDEVINANTVKLPCGVGSFYIAKNKINYEKKGRIPTDFNLSKREHKRILNFNEHTNGFIYRFCWTTDKTYKKYHRLFRFEAVRTRKRELAQILKDGIKDYIVKKNARI